MQTVRNHLQSVSPSLVPIAAYTAAGEAAESLLNMTPTSRPQEHRSPALLRRSERPTSTGLLNINEAGVICPQDRKSDPTYSNLEAPRLIDYSSVIYIPHFVDHILPRTSPRISLQIPLIIPLVHSSLSPQSERSQALHRQRYPSADPRRALTVTCR